MTSVNMILVGVFNDWILLLCLGLIRTAYGCPSSCSCDERVVSCSGVTGFPVDLQSDVVRLTIIDSEIAVVKRDHFVRLLDLEMLHLAGDMIQNIENGSFMGLQKLYYISLEGNRLTTIESATFANMNLQRLYLNDNTGLSAIDPDAFHNATIDNLYMANCSLNKQSLQNVLTSLGRHLNNLDVSGNAGALLLDQDLFSGSLFRSLLLRNNGIHDLTFLDGVVTDMLDLSGNPIQDSAWNVTAYVPDVKELILENVAMTSISVTSPSESLLVLNIGRNNITHFAGQDLHPFPNLETLILKDNGIILLPHDLAQHVDRLVVLDVSGNKLIGLDPETLTGLNLLVLNASYNLITSLSGSLKEMFDYIRNIDLTANPFHCNCQIRWLADWLRHLPSDRNEVIFGRCRTPPQYVERLIWRMDPEELVCSSPVILMLASGGRTYGDALTIECKAKADPAARLQLYRDHVLLVTVHSPDRLEQQTNCLYHVTGLSCADVGNYTCVATNMAGVDEDWAIIGEILINICRNNGTIPTETSDSTTTITDTDIVKSPGGSSSYWIPVLVVFIVLVIFGVILTLLLWRRRSRRKYNFRSDASNNNDDVSYANSAFDREQNPSDHVMSNDVASGNGHVTSITPDVN